MSEFLINKNISINRGAILGYVCNLCVDAKFNSFSELNHHMKKYHGQQVRIPKTQLKPWKDPESLFCDTEFLDDLIGKKVRRGDECKDNIPQT